jgi:CheY-like chemotaxis protein
MEKYKYNLIMLVDDDEIDNFVTKKMIDDNKFSKKLIVKLSSEEALTYLKKEQNNPDELPEVILLDILMPVMDGFGFLDEFDKLNETVKNKCKIVLLSTSESFKDLNRANKNKYVSKFLTKPLIIEALNAINV